MCKHTNKLREYLDQNPIAYADGDSLLEQLYWCYWETNSLDTVEIRMQYEKLRHSMPEITEERFDEIFGVINELSVLQEKAAFQAGAKIGMRLAAELWECTKTPPVSG